LKNNVKYDKIDALKKKILQKSYNLLSMSTINKVLTGE